MMNPLLESEIFSMRSVGRLAARVLAEAGETVRPGVSTEQIDRMVHELTLSLGAFPAPLGYKGYPKSVCTSVNHCICHGVPNSYVLKEGDIVNIDVTCVKDGFHGDTSRTFYVGEVSEQARAVTECAYHAMCKGIEKVQANQTTEDIGFAINKYVTRKGFYPVLEIGGHGIGKNFHEEPFIPSHGKKGRGEPLKEDCCITVEPMIKETNASIAEFDIPDSDIKYYETADRTLSAQFEHTVLIRGKGEPCEILTQPETPFQIGY